MKRTDGTFVVLVLTLLAQPSGCSSDSAGGGGGHPLADAGKSDAGASSCTGGPDASPDVPDASTPTSPMCDMNGRWLVASRVLAQAIGQTQASHNWFYYEIRQNGDRLTVTKGLNCGFEVVAVSALGANVDSHLAWPSLLLHDSDTGRAGTMTVAGAGCQLDLEKRYTVRGATTSYYDDPTTTMPTATQQAKGCTPGWEDWDMDGHPGITLTVTGAASGHLYCAQRDWNQWGGAVAANPTSFHVPVLWDAGQDPLGYDPSGSSLVTQSAAPATDPTEHNVWFVKLDPTQATGDDTAICAAVRALVPTVAPDALK